MYNEVARRPRRQDKDADRRIREATKAASLAAKIQTFPDPDAVVAEIRRSLKDSGYASNLLYELTGHCTKPPSYGTWETAIALHERFTLTDSRA